MAEPEQRTREGEGITRRRMIGYLVAAPTLVAAATWDVEPALASVPTKQPIDAYDLSDLLADSAMPTAGLVAVVVNKDGTVTYRLPRAEVGQGITTAVAMVIADEMDLPVSKVRVPLSDARPELLFNQLTAGSATMTTLYEPIRAAAAIARGRLLDAAAHELGVDPSALDIVDGVIHAPGGKTLPIGPLATKAAAAKTSRTDVRPKAAADRAIVGRPHRRIDAHDAVTGAKKFAMDLHVKGALPTMVCRPPTINGRALAILNKRQVLRMPGVTHVVLVPHSATVPGGVAVRARTFGQCIDGIRALRVRWAGGSTGMRTEKSIRRDLVAAELPLTPALPGSVIDKRFTFHFRPGDPLEPNCAVADVRQGSARIWSSLKSPIWAKEQIAKDLGLPLDKVAVHVAQGGGSFGRHLFCDAAFEAAVISRKIGRPVRLMWSRADGPRQGRAHPLTISRVRAVHSAGNVLSLDQRHTCVATDFTQGLGELVTAQAATPPEQNFLQYSQTVFNLTANVPYDFGAVTQLLNEVYEYNTFNTSSVRNVYSPEVRVAVEMMVDELAKAMGKDRYAFRRSFVRDDRVRAVLDKVAKVGKWGRKLGPGRAQGIALHREYHGAAACLVEIDCRRRTVRRKVKYGYTGPRVTKAIYAVDVGLPINPLGVQAMMMGGMMDGIAQALSYSLHLRNGHFAEASWDHAHYTRQWNVPPHVEVIVMPSTTGKPGGAGEFGVAATMAAVASAYGAAVGKVPTTFPINHKHLDFDPYPTVPSIPPSPTDGLDHYPIPA